MMGWEGKGEGREGERSVSGLGMSNYTHKSYGVWLR